MSEFGSELLLPSKVTRVFAVTFLSAPALAKGCALAAPTVTTTRLGALSTLPSFTVSKKAYEPSRSAIKVGCDAVVDNKVAVELTGLEIKVHR